MTQFYEYLKVSRRKANIHVTQKSQRDCVCQLYMKIDPVTSIPFFNLISVDSENTKDPAVLQRLGRLIDEAPVIGGEYMCIYSSEPKDNSTPRNLPSIISMDYKTLNEDFVKNPSWNDMNNSIYSELDKPTSFRFLNRRFILETGEELTIDDLQKNYVLTDKDKKHHVFPNQTLPKIAEDFLNLTTEIKSDGIHLIKEIRKNITKEVFIEPQVQMEITLLDAILSNVSDDVKPLFSQQDVRVSEDVWSDISDTTDNFLSLPSGLSYSSLPTLSMVKNMMISGLGENIWNLSKDIFRAITPVSLEDVRTIASPNAYNSPFENYLMQLEAVGVEKKVSSDAYLNIKKIYNPDDIKLYAVGDLEVLYVKDQYQESFYFFPSIEYLNADNDMGNNQGMKI